MKGVAQTEQPTAKDMLRYNAAATDVYYYYWIDKASAIGLWPTANQSQFPVRADRLCLCMICPKESWDFPQ